MLKVFAHAEESVCFPPINQAMVQWLGSFKWRGSAGASGTPAFTAAQAAAKPYERLGCGVCSGISSLSHFCARLWAGRMSML